MMLEKKEFPNEEFAITNVVMNPSQERLTFIDALRGYAILMMLQGHTIGVVLQEQFRDQKYPVFMVWRYLTGLTAPVFFLSAGLIFSFLMAKAESSGDSRLSKGVKRGLWLMVLGWILQIWPPILKDAWMGELWSALRFIGKSHVLHTIGFSLLIMVGLWLACQRRERLFAGAAFVLAQLALLSGPQIEQWMPANSWQRIPATFISREFAVFPLLPWVGYALMGAALGVLAWRTKWYRSRRWFIALAVIGFILMQGNHLITGAFWTIVGGLEDYQLSEYSGRYWRVGEVLTFVGLMGLFCHFLQQRGWEEKGPMKIVTTCGRETLTIYFLHIFVVYGVVFGVGLAPFFAREFGVWTSIATALTVQILFILLAMNLPKLRKACPWLSLLR